MCILNNIKTDVTGSYAYIEKRRTILNFLYQKEVFDTRGNFGFAMQEIRVKISNLRSKAQVFDLFCKITNVFYRAEFNLIISHMIRDRVKDVVV